MQRKKKRIEIRVDELQKEKWTKLCRMNNITMTDLIVSSVEKKLLSNDRTSIVKYIEKQDNYFSKVENNINQFAKIANAQKFISNNEMASFNRLLEEVSELKKEQGKIISNIFFLLGK